MKRCRLLFFLCFAAFALSASGQTDPNWDNNIPCSGGGSPQCCQNPGACNGPGGADGWSFDPDNSGSGGCYYNCIPIDSGLLFLLLGGGVFGAFLINRQRNPSWDVKKAKAH